MPANEIKKPWGKEIIWANTEKYVGKILVINAGHSLSLQYHQIKDETIYILSGKIKFEYYVEHEHPNVRIMQYGDLHHITPHTRHRMTAIEDTQILEASTPELDDVVRLEDLYGRV